MSAPSLGGSPKLLRFLDRLAHEAPSRALCQDLLDQMADSADAERAFLFWRRKDGGFRVLLARNRDGDDLPTAQDKLGHHVVQRVIERGEPVQVRDARRDRRFHTAEGSRTGRQPHGLLALPVRLRGEVAGGVYLDHRFQPLRASPAAVDEVAPWLNLLEIALQARERERQLRAARRLRAWSSDDGGDARAAGLPATFSPAKALVEFHGLFASAPDMLDLFDEARRMGQSDLALVIHGETGTGKDLLARAIHVSSPRAARQFLVVGCGGIPDPLLESELFGHARGAFTGADIERTGLLVEADGGTLLLDEVADMSPQMQQKLLRVLQDGRVRPLGRRTAVKVDVRILSSTQHDLERLVKEGLFRRDLYYRLRGTVLQVPPLRERCEEIPLLAARFLARYAAERGAEPPTLTESSLRVLLRHTWPGNVRELENEMRRLAASGDATVEAAQLSPSVRGKGNGPGAASLRAEPLSMAGVVSVAEREAILQALGRAGGNRSRAALVLGITRKALYRRMARYGIR